MLGDRSGGSEDVRRWRLVELPPLGPKADAHRSAPRASNPWRSIVVGEDDELFAVLAETTAATESPVLAASFEETVLLLCTEAMAIDP